MGFAKGPTHLPSLRANGPRECAPDDRLREAIHLAARQNENWIAWSLMLLAMTGSGGMPILRVADLPRSAPAARCERRSPSLTVLPCDIRGWRDLPPPGRDRVRSAA